MINFEINIQNLKNGWFQYSTIYRGFLITKLYDTKRKSNINDFKLYAEYHKYI